MTDLLKIAAAFALIVILLRLKWNFGAVMLLAAVTLGALYRIGPRGQLSVLGSSVADPVTLNLIGGLVLIGIGIERRSGCSQSLPFTNPRLECSSAACRHHHATRARDKIVSSRGVGAGSHDHAIDR